MYLLILSSFVCAGIKQLLYIWWINSIGCLCIVQLFYLAPRYNYPKSFFSTTPQRFASAFFFSTSTFVGFQKIVSWTFVEFEFYLHYYMIQAIQNGANISFTVESIRSLLALLILFAITNHREDENRKTSKLKQSNNIICRNSFFFSF